MCIDAVITEITQGSERYDRDGKRAAQGTPYQPLINEWLKHPFFLMSPPKTTGREMFGHTYAMECLVACRKHALSDNACIATLTELTVQTIANYIARFVAEQNPIDTLYVSGGGVHNQTIMRRLGELLVGTAVESVGNSGISADAKEAIAFAILANETLHGNPGNLPSATGASVRKGSRENSCCHDFIVFQPSAVSKARHRKLSVVFVILSILLNNFEITPNLREDIMREVPRIKPIIPSNGDWFPSVPCGNHRRLYGDYCVLDVRYRC